MSEQICGHVGLVDYLTDGNIGVPVGQSRNGALMVAQTRGKYYESTSRGKCFFAANQADTTWSVALNTTHTGFVVYNPVGSGVNLSILKASFALVVAPAAIASVGLFGGGNTVGIATHTTPLTVYNRLLQSTSGSKAGADAAATLVGTPIWIDHFLGGFTAAALPSTSPAVIDVDGSIVVPPGYYCGIGALTAVHGMASMMWEEIPQ